jgi:hypothetical protein
MITAHGYDLNSWVLADLGWKIRSFIKRKIEARKEIKDMQKRALACIWATGVSGNAVD